MEMIPFSEQHLIHATAVASAKQLAERHRPRIALAEHMRQLPTETTRDLIQSGLVRLLKPSQLGGNEASFQTFFDCIVEIGKVDASAAWCCGFLMLHSWFLAFFPIETQQAVWQQDPDALIAAAFTPAMQVNRTPGGFRISGTSPFVSAIDPASWVMVAGFLSGEDDSQQKKLLLFLLPRSDYTIHDDWYVMGLKATGSNSVTVRDVFVPNARTIDLLGLRDGDASAYQQEIYHIPLLTVASLVVLAPMIGATLGAYELWLSIMRNGATALSRERIAEFTHVQISSSRLSASIEMIQLLISETLHKLRHAPISPEERTAIRRNYVIAGKLCRDVMVELFGSGGAAFIALEHPMQRYLRDVLAAYQHAALRFEEIASQHGRLQLGLPLAFAHDLY